MLLRKLMRHVQTQNWFAVALDFVIVVLGVFLAVQLGNWNEARKEIRNEHLLIMRLDGEIDSLLAVTRDEMSEFSDRVAPSVTATPVIFSQEPSRPLTIRECEWIAGSHVYRTPTDELPVLDEMVASGRLDLIKDQEVKRQLRDYIYSRERERGNLTERTNELFRLYHLHPDVIQLTRGKLEDDYPGRWTFLSGEGYRWVVNCDIDRMRRDESFRNDYIDNLGRNNGMLTYYHQREEQLLALKSVVTASLGE